MIAQQHFVKLIEVDGYQVAFINRGAGAADTDGCIAFEMVTRMDDAVISTTLDIPEEREAEAFDSWGEENARQYIETVRSMLAPQPNHE